MSGYVKPNYTQIPNTLLDQHLPHMKEAELKVVLAIARATLGWHKQRDKLSLSQLMEKTGLTRQGVVNGIQDGIERGVIGRKSNGMGFLYYLVIDEKSEDADKKSTKLVNEADYSENKLVNEVDQSTKKTSQRSRPKLVNEVDQKSTKLVNEVDTQKKEIKEKEKNDNSDDKSLNTQNHYRHPSSASKTIAQSGNGKPEKQDFDFIKVARLLEENDFGKVTGVMAKQLGELIHDYSAGWVEDAITVSIENNVRKLRYLTKVLENWKRDGRNGKPKSPAKTATLAPDVPDYILKMQQGIGK